MSVDYTVNAGGTKVCGLLASAEVAAFRGIPFATIAQRFRPAQSAPLSQFAPELTAKAWGHSCLQSHNRGRVRRAYLYHGIDTPAPEQSEIDCLNLNIYTPSDSTNNAAPLPVLVWVHGGGFVFGDGGPDYDGTALVQTALKFGKPFICVTINYRLGYHGFLDSSELRQESSRLGEPHMCNLGLQDQRLALQWVHDHIGFFGGDAQRVTVAGQSAGAWSALSHITNTTALCYQVLAMSPTVISFKSETESQAEFDWLVSAAGVAPDASPEGKLAALRKLNDTQMSELLDGAVLIRPCWDDALFPALASGTRLDQLGVLPSYVQGILIGSTRDETAAAKPAWEKLTSQQICNIVISLCDDPVLAQEVIETYTLNSQCKGVAAKGIIDFTTESFFGLFPKVLGENCPNVCVYQFDQVDDFEESPTPGAAYHCLDLPFLFQTPAVAGHQASLAMQETCKTMALAVASFVQGDRPWGSFQQSSTLMVINGTGTALTKGSTGERWRRFCDRSDRMSSFVDLGRKVMTYRIDRMQRALIQ